MGVLYTMHRGDIGKGFIRNVYQGDIYKTWGNNKNHIGSRPEIYVSILGSIYSKTKDISNDVNSILSTNRRTNRTIKSDNGAVFITLCKPCTEQLGIIITSYTVCI